MDKKYTPKILITTGAGNTINGGADIWTNHFLKLVWRTLPNFKEWFLLIDSKRPTDFDPTSLPKGLQYHFHYDDPNKTKDWLEKAQKIDVLHSHYHKREHIWKYEDKFDTIFVHAYPREMVDVIEKIPETNKLQFNTKVDVNFYDDYLATFKKRVWIGCNETELFKNHPNYTYTIPNFYEFIQNDKISNYVKSGRVGYAARIESRKLFHWLEGLEGYALTDQRDFKNLKDIIPYQFKNISVYQWNPDIHHFFMCKNWGIFHGAHIKEPFGYNIFQAVDYGKIPIINTDWCPELKYKYRARTMNEFHKMVKQIVKDSEMENMSEFNSIKNYMQKFTNKQEWVHKVRQMIIPNNEKFSL